MNVRDTNRQAAFARLWEDARAGDEARLCARGADADLGLAPSCIDWAALATRASSNAAHFFLGADVPDDVTVAFPSGAPTPDLDTVWSLDVRVVFDWRNYR